MNRGATHMHEQTFRGPRAAADARAYLDELRGDDAYVSGEVIRREGRNGPTFTATVYYTPGPAPGEQYDSDCGSHY